MGPLPALVHVAQKLNRAATGTATPVDAPCARLVAVHVAGKGAKAQLRQVSKARARHVGRHILARRPGCSPVLQACSKRPLPWVGCCAQNMEGAGLLQHSWITACPHSTPCTGCAWVGPAAWASTAQGQRLP